MLILYRIKRNFCLFIFLKKVTLTFQQNKKWLFLILSFVAGYGAFQIPIYVLLFYMIKSGVFPTSVAHYPAAYKRNQFDTTNEKVCEIFKQVTFLSVVLIIFFIERVTSGNPRAAICIINFLCGIFV